MIIGITGGIGAGKSTILNILKNNYCYNIFEADAIAKEIMTEGNAVYNKIVEYFGTEILNDDNSLNSEKISSIVFNNRDKLNMLNNIVHPGVIEEIERRIANLRNHGEDKFVIEAALLIESGCYKLCDQIWYIDTNTDVRRKRLKESRNLTDKRIDEIIGNQLDKSKFLKYSDIVIDNSSNLSDTALQIQKLLEF